MTPSEKQKRILALIGLAFFYASMGIFTRFLNTNFSIFQQLYLRLFAGAIISTILFRLKSGKIRVIFFVNHELKRIIIRKIGFRKDVYRQLNN